MAFFSSSPPGKLALVVDVGSSSVGAAVVLLPKERGNVPFILSSARTPIALQERLSFNRFMGLMLKALAASVADALRNAPGRPGRIYCFLASPWYASQVRTVKLKKNRGFVFDEAVLRELGKREAEAFETEKAREYKHLKDQLRFIERETIDIKVNGYRMADPFGRQAKEVEASFFFGVSTEETASRLSLELEKLMSGAPIVFHSFLLPFFAVVRDLFPEAKDAILIDIGGEITDVSFMKDGLLSTSGSFPLGRNFLLRRASAVLKKNMEEARSALRLLAEGKLEPKARDALVLALRPVEAEWLHAFHEALEAAGNSMLLPHRVYLFADGDVVKWFIDAIGKEEYGQYTLSLGKFEVTVIGASFLARDVSFSATITARDQFLGVESIFAGMVRA